MCRGRQRFVTGPERLTDDSPVSAPKVYIGPDSKEYYLIVYEVWNNIYNISYNKIENKRNERRTYSICLVSRYCEPVVGRLGGAEGPQPLPATRHLHCPPYQLPLSHPRRALQPQVRVPPPPLPSPFFSPLYLYSPPSFCLSSPSLHNVLSIH